GQMNALVANEGRLSLGGALASDVPHPGILEGLDRASGGSFRTVVEHDDLDADPLLFQGAVDRFAQLALPPKGGRDDADVGLALGSTNRHSARFYPIASARAMGSAPGLADRH